MFSSRFLSVALTLVAASKGYCKRYGSPSNKIVAGYYPDYHSDVLPAANVNYQQYTHINYFVAYQNYSSPSAPLIVSNETNMKAFVKLAHQNNVAVSISVGGWTGSRFFSDDVSSATNRTAFVNNLASYMKKYGFDGIDIDWEYPNRQGIGCNSIRPDDTANFLLMLQALRAKVGSQKILSAAVPMGGFNGPDGNYVQDLSGFVQVLDYITIMAYDVIGPGYYSPDYFTGPCAPLYDTCLPPIAKIAGASSVADWRSYGFPPGKIVLGLPAYGYGYTTLSKNLATTTFVVNGTKYSTKTLQNTTSTNTPGGALDDPAGVDVCGQKVGFGGSWLYAELVSTKKLDNEKGSSGSSGYVRYWDSCSNTPFLFNEQKKHFISYDDVQSYKAKGTFAKQNNLGGVNVFDLTGDTPNAVLLKAVRSVLL